MVSKISVLIAEDDSDCCELLSKILSQESDIEVVGVAQDGLIALEMIAEYEPCVVILDIIMPKLDGIGVLEKLAESRKEYKPVVIVLSALAHDMFVQKTISLGVDYYIIKPYNTDMLIKRIRQSYSERDLYRVIKSEKLDGLAKINDKKDFKYNGSLPPSYDLQVTDIIKKIGISPHKEGFQYLREAIIQSIENPNVFSSVTKYLYPGVADKFKTTPQKVERAIRNVIKSSWESEKQKVFNEIFTDNNWGGKPTNSEFVAYVASKIKNNLMKY